MATTFSVTGDTKSAEQLIAENPELAVKLWRHEVEKYEFTNNFFSKYEGTGPNSVVLINKDSEKVASGGNVTIRNIGEFYGIGRKGAQTFTEEKHFDEDKVSAYSFKVDYLENGYIIDKRTAWKTMMLEELKNGTPGRLKRWMNRQKEAETLARLLKDEKAPKPVIAGGRSSIDGLTASDTLRYNDVVIAEARLSRNGGRPFKTVVRGEQLQGKYLVPLTPPARAGIETDDDWKDMLKSAGHRGDGNSLFTGILPTANGNVFADFQSIDTDSDGTLGTLLDPRGRTSTEITVGTVAFDIYAGARANPKDNDYLRHFPGARWEYNTDDVGSPTSVDDTTGNKYLLLWDEADNKVAMVRYTQVSTDGSGKRKITVTGTLAASASGIGVVSFGSVTYAANSANFKSAFPIGSWIIPCNAKGVPYGTTPVLGGASVMNGYGFEKDIDAYDFIQGSTFETAKRVRRFFRTIFGTGLPKNLNNEVVGYTTIKHALVYPGLPQLVAT
ncbi:MAG: hypothetical protein LBT00_13275 [Spirochaetaceae bacterium]|jgi:hypothetical protein|nr:hypothetical protein [Spirochaetaceae bacterium]